MIHLDTTPKNERKFLGLVDFLKEILAVCHLLNIEPVLSGSLAVFAYTRSQVLNVNDIDLACSESDFPRISEALSGTAVECRLKEWHVLQVWKGDLKIEFDLMEHWMQGISRDYEILRLDRMRLKMVRLADLRELYRRGLSDATNSDSKHKTLHAKYKLLSQADSCC